MMSDRRAQGFTLVEVIVVLVLVGLVLGVVAPAVSWQPDRASDADPLVQVLAAARHRALRGALTVEVTVDPVRKRVWVRDRSTVPGLDTSFVLALPDSVVVSSPSARAGIRFEPDGSATADPLILLVGTRTLAVIVDEMTGSVSVAAPKAGAQ